MERVEAVQELSSPSLCASRLGVHAFPDVTSSVSAGEWLTASCKFEEREAAAPARRHMRIES